MAEQLVINRYREEEEDTGLNWPRIIGIAFVIALHAAALLMLLIPAVAPPAEKEQKDRSKVSLVNHNFINKYANNQTIHRTIACLVLQTVISPI